MTGKKGSTHYSSETQEEAVRLLLEKKLCKQAIAEQLGICDAERIEKWVHDYRQEGLLGLHRVKGRPRKQTEGVAAELQRLRMENALLKKLHAELRKAGIEESSTE
jgi:transposase-like protein